MKRCHARVSRIGAGGLLATPAAVQARGRAHGIRQDPCGVLLIARDGTTSVFSNCFEKEKRS